MWVHPKMDRASVATKTNESDLNRINGNINYLWATLLKADYTSADIVLTSDWDETISNTNEIAELMEMEEVTSSTHYENLNAIENIAKAYWDINPLFPADYNFPQEDTYPR